ncbi:SCPU domain-containing protein [Pseudomonas sp. TKO26]|uniref:Spore coat protein U (SCPU) domain-containing protein n=1 Tax=Pseudomonas saponiphila TaxID=556534 RepID=A0A1H4LU47_9PSED|nr:MULTISPECIES: spore coat U domain-containing protein [Pseudomonas]PYY87247.1 SCPU domain-containing protein [Pseudomonas sp. TKO30]PYY90110.1 SCPU domain-containing protein [Pseudomonas sp. TKO29]PYY93198.1 SCPU domain-containing protein [Pseudomonas sp. TKO26]PYZ00328.1 SCPU domain-containing protein [Pseudomonas sp. TKO14]SEB74279.1 Spore coat protein U (SCPU) domain-containing protein [Pseudomonas saponiphila]
MKGRNWTIIALGSLCLLVDDAQAAISGQIQARLVIQASCQVSSAGNDPAAGPVSDSGLLDFGRQGPTWVNPIKASLSDSAEGRLQVACNPSVTGFTVTINGGLNGDGTTRRLSNGRQTIPYRLFVDASGSDSYSIDQQRNFAVSSGRRIPIPVFGSVVANTRAVPAGVYTDTLTITLDW